MTPVNIYQDKKFSNYAQENGKFENKPHVSTAVQLFQEVFESDKQITIYAREEDDSFKWAISTLASAFEEEKSRGRIIGQFYDKKYHAEGGLTPFFQFGQLLKPEERPYVTTRPTFVYSDVLDFVTRLGFATILMEEQEHINVVQFNAGSHSIRLLEVPRLSDTWYLGHLAVDHNTKFQL